MAIVLVEGDEVHRHLARRRGPPSSRAEERVSRSQAERGKAAMRGVKEERTCFEAEQLAVQATICKERWIGRLCLALNLILLHLFTCTALAMFLLLLLSKQTRVWMGSGRVSHSRLKSPGQGSSEAEEQL